MTGHVDVHAGLPERPVVRLRPERASRLIGLDVPPDEQRATLRGFGFDVSDEWDVTVPTWRARDVTREVDVIEEVARPLLDRVPLTMPLRRHVRGRLTKEQRLRRVVEDALVGAGLSEAYTWSLVATDPSPDAIRLPSPMTSDQAILRTTIVPGPRRGRAHGRRRRRRRRRAVRDRARLPPLGRAAARRALACRRRGRGRLRGRQGRPRDALRRARARAPRRARVARAAPSGQGGRRPRRAGSASCTRRSSRAPGGRSSSTSRRSSRQFRSASSTRTSSRTRRRSRTSRSPWTRTSRSARSSTPRARQPATLLREARVFDVYRGDQVGAGRKSVAIHLAFQSPERTLTEDEATDAREPDRRGARRAVRCASFARSNPIDGRMRVEGDDEARRRQLVAGSRRTCSTRCRRRGSSVAPGAEARRDRRAWVHDLARRTRRATASRSSIPGRTRSRSTDRSDFHNFHLQGPGVERGDGRRVHRHGDVDGHADGRDVRVRLRRPSVVDARLVHCRDASATPPRRRHRPAAPSPPSRSSSLRRVPRR